MALIYLFRTTPSNNEMKPLSVGKLKTGGPKFEQIKLNKAQRLLTETDRDRQLKSIYIYFYTL